MSEESSLLKRREESRGRGRGRRRGKGGVAEDTENDEARQRAEVKKREHMPVVILLYRQRAHCWDRRTNRAEEATSAVKLFQFCTRFCSPRFS